MSTFEYAGGLLDPCRRTFIINKKCLLHTAAWRQSWKDKKGDCSMIHRQFLKTGCFENVQKGCTITFSATFPQLSILIFSLKLLKDQYELTTKFKMKTSRRQHITGITAKNCYYSGRQFVSLIVQLAVLSRLCLDREHWRSASEYCWGENGQIR